MISNSMIAFSLSIAVFMFVISILLLLISCDYRHPIVALIGYTVSVLAFAELVKLVLISGF